jgi:hypothetical protein
MKSLKKLLDIEEKSDLWESHINNTYLWPILRTGIFSSLIYSDHGYLQPHAGGKRFKIFKPAILKELLKCHNFLKSKKRGYDSVFFTTEVLQTLNKKTQLYYDRLYSHYYNEFHLPLIFTNRFQSQVFRPTEHEKNLYLEDYVAIIATLKSFLEDSSEHDAEIRNFCNEIQKQYSFSHPEKSTDILRRLLPKVTYYHDYVDNIVSRMDGNVVFIHCASYLGIGGEITRRFKEHGVKTVEVQHGYVGPEHYAYNYPSGTAERVMKEYLPDYYLTFGKYWGEQIQTPSTIVTVGNPALNGSVDVLQTTISSRSNSILVVSQGTITLKMVKIAKYLSETLPHYTIIFKLHHGEVPFTHRYEDLKKYHNVQIRTYDNIYELIASSEIIVGFNSTTLFEAVAFSGKRIFILNNEMIPDSLGYKFSSCEELRDAILDGESGYPSAQPSSFWEPDWETNIASFLGNLPS